MSITVRLRGDLGRFTESPTVELEGGRRSLGEVLEELVSRFPALGAVLFDETGRVRSGILLVVEGRSLAWPDDKDASIHEGGELLVTRFLAGG
jgi:molybdopterin converting factor small subunit